MDSVQTDLPTVALQDARRDIDVVDVPPWCSSQGVRGGVRRSIAGWCAADMAAWAAAYHNTCVPAVPYFLLVCLLVCLLVGSSARRLVHLASLLTIIPSFSSNRLPNSLTSCAQVQHPLDRLLSPILVSCRAMYANERLLGQSLGRSFGQ